MLFVFLLITSWIIPACASKQARIAVPSPTYWPTQAWQWSTPEEQGFDAAKVAEGLQASGRVYQ